MNTQSSSYDVGLNRFFSKVYLKTALGIGVSAVVSFILATALPQIPYMIYSNPIGILALLLVEVMICFMCSRRAYNGNGTSTMIWFIVYSVINAITLSAVFMIINDVKLIAEAFLVTAVTFVALSLYGHYTKRNLSSWRNFLFGTLIGVMIALIVNLFLHSGAIGLLCNIVAVVLFAAYTAYDTQMIKSMYYSMNNNGEASGLSTYGAMVLYMDFINMFINLLYLFSDSDN